MATNKTIVQCGHCDRKYRVRSELVGTTARCPNCRHRFRLTPKATLDDSVLDWLLDDEDADDKADDNTPAANAT